jgi:hypothetical protein
VCGEKIVDDNGADDQWEIFQVPVRIEKQGTAE